MSKVREQNPQLVPPPSTPNTTYGRCPPSGFFNPESSPMPQPSTGRGVSPAFHRRAGSAVRMHDISAHPKEAARASWLAPVHCSRERTCLSSRQFLSTQLNPRFARINKPQRLHLSSPFCPPPTAGPKAPETFHSSCREARLQQWKSAVPAIGQSISSPFDFATLSPCSAHPPFCSLPWTGYAMTDQNKNAKSCRQRKKSFFFSSFQLR